MFFAFTHIKLQGKENLPTYPNTPAIIIMNHTSALDIFIIENIIASYPHIWLTKKEYTKIPLFSILLNRMHIPLERKNEIAAARALLRAYHRAKQLESHLILFPEGTRHDDGRIHPFHLGFAILAKKLNRPIIPIFTTNLHQIFPKNKFFIKYHAAQPTMTIGKPMRCQENESFKNFSVRVENWFRKLNDQPPNNHRYNTL